MQAFGGIDILVSSTALGPELPSRPLPPDGYDRVLHTDLRAPYFCAQAAARRMVAQGRGGQILYVGAPRSLGPIPGYGAHSTARGGLHLLTRRLSRELAPHHIRVNCVAPGTNAAPCHPSRFPTEERDPIVPRLPGAGRASCTISPAWLPSLHGRPAASPVRSSSSATRLTLTAG